MHARRRRGPSALIVTLVAAAGLSLVAPAPAAAHHSSADCNKGYDSDPSYPIALATNDTVCVGHMSTAEPNKTWWPGGYKWQDGYSYSTTVDDGVEVTYWANNGCIHAWGPGWSAYPDDNEYEVHRIVSDRDGTQVATVDYTNISFDGGGCWSTRPTNYSIQVAVTPNDRPVINYAGPSSLRVEPLTNLTFAFSAADVDDNLRRLGFRVGEGFWHAGRFIDNITWVDATEGQEKSFTAKFTESKPVYLFAEDHIGARATRSVPVTVVGPDCGLDGDVDTTPGLDLNASLPRFDCDRAWVWQSDKKDTYTFDVPAGTERVYARVLKTAGDPGPWSWSAGLTLRKPSGATLTPTNLDSYFFRSVVTDADETGTWSVDVSQLSGKGGAYSLRVWFVGPPDAPGATASWSPAAIHQGNISSLAVTPSDPGGQFVQLTEIQWGDGSTTTFYPQWVDTGATWTHSSYGRHRFWHDQTAPPVAVVLTNEEGQTATVPVGGPAVRLHDDCGLAAPGASFDAPQVLGSTAPVVATDATCSGTLGHGLPAASGLDDTDYYRISVTEPSRVHVRMTRTGSLDARPYLYTTVGGFPFGPYLGGDTAEIPVAIGTVYVRALHLSGAGDYSLDISTTPLS